MTSTEKMVYSIEEAAEQLGIGRTMVYSLLRRGELTSIKIGSRRLIRRTDLETFLRGNDFEVVA